MVTLGYQIGQFLQQTPGNMLYHLVLLFILFAAYQGITITARNSRFLHINKIKIGIAILFLLQMVPLLAALLIWVTNLDAHVLLPPLDRAINAVSLVWLIWLWVFPDSKQRITLTGIAVSAIFGLGWLVTFLIWISQSTGLSFNASGYALGWDIALVVLAVAGVISITLTRKSHWFYGLIMFAVLLVGNLLQLLPAGWVGDFPGFQRIGFILAFPLLPFLALRLFPPPLHEITKEQENMFIERRRYSMQLHTLQDWMTTFTSTSPESLAPMAARSLAETMLADFCYLLPFPRKVDDLIFLCGYDQALEKELPGFSKPVSLFPQLSSALLQASPLIKNVSSEPDLELDYLAEFAGLQKAANILYVPLADEQINWGGMLFFTSQLGRTWTDEDKTYLESISMPVLQLLSGKLQPFQASAETDKLQNELYMKQKELEELETAFQQILLEYKELEETSTTDNLSEFEGSAETDELFSLDGTFNQSLQSAGVQESQLEVQVSQELQLALEEMAHIQQQLGEAKEKIHQLENTLPESQPESASNIKTDAIAYTTQETHEPLESLSANIELLLSESTGELTAVQKKLVEQIRSTSDRLQTLINDVSRLSTWESSPELNLPAEFNLMSAIDLAISETRNDFLEKSCTLRMDVSSELPPIASNEDIFTQVLIQLLHNAIQASCPEGTVEIKARVESRADSQFLLVEVRDSGTGIKPEDIPLIFEKPNEKNSQRIPGLGVSTMSLYITKTLIETLHGSIGVAGVEGSGSTFYFSIPIFLTEHAADNHDEFSE